jgi:hypothetical protein
MPLMTVDPYIIMCLIQYTPDIACTVATLSGMHVATEKAVCWNRGLALTSAGPIGHVSAQYRRTGPDNNVV